MPITIYVPRVLGGTLILTLSPVPPAQPVSVNAYGRDGKVNAYGRDGKVTAYGRDSKTTARGH